MNGAGIRRNVSSGWFRVMWSVAGVCEGAAHFFPLPAVIWCCCLCSLSCSNFCGASVVGYLLWLFAVVFGSSGAICVYRCIG